MGVRPINGIDPASTRNRERETKTMNRITLALLLITGASASCADLSLAAFPAEESIGRSSSAPGSPRRASTTSPRIGTRPEHVRYHRVQANLLWNDKFRRVPSLHITARNALSSPVRGVVGRGLLSFSSHPHRISETGAEPAILDHFEGPNGTIAAWAIAALGTERAREAILPLADDPDASVRREILRLLYAHFPDEPIKIAVRFLDDPDATVRAQAAASLGETLERDAVPHLLEAASDPDEGVRTAAATAIEKIREHHDNVTRWAKWLAESGTEGRTTAEALVHQAHPPNPKWMRVAAIRSLGTVGDPDTLPVLVLLRGDDDPEIARAAREALDRINEAPARNGSDD